MRGIRAAAASATALIFGVTALTLASEGHAAFHFSEVADASGIHAVMRCGGPEKRWIPEANGSGLAWLDYDNDGLMDLLIVNGSTMAGLRATLAGEKPKPLAGSVFLYHNLGHGKFEDVTERAGLNNPYWGTGANAADYNNDGFTDILITTIGSDLLYRNNGDGTFTEVSGPAGLSREIAWHTGSAFGDFDGDGLLDLYVAGYVDIHSISLAEPAPVCPYMGYAAFCGPIGLKGGHGILYRNNGNGTFTDVTKKAGMALNRSVHSFTAVFDDFNGDGKIDLFVANDSDPNLLFLNQGNGLFRESALDRGVAVNGNGQVQANMGVAVGDLTHEGKLSVLTTTFMNDYFPLFRQDSSGVFDDVSSEAGLTGLTKLYLGWACGFVDFDNDGQRDLWLANGHVYPKSARYFQPVSVLSAHKGKFTPKYQFPAIPDNSYRGGAAADFDNDGQMDLAILPVGGRPLLLHNDTENKNHWVGLQLRGTKSNRDAIGASVQVKFCGTTAFDTVRNGGSYLSRNDPRVHFGLGECNKLDGVYIRWPSALSQQVDGVSLNRYTVIEERK